MLNTNYMFAIGGLKRNEDTCMNKFVNFNELNITSCQTRQFVIFFPGYGSFEN